MIKPVNILYKTMMPYFFLIKTIVILISCSQNNPQQAAVEKKETFKPPVTIAVTAPRVTLLDTCPPPLTFAIPENKKDSFVLKIDNSKRIIHSPEIKPADFSVLMPNYNTEQGIENSVIRDGVIDESGAIWFVTFSGGLSRYDGKSFTNYTTAEGLVFNLTNCIMIDKDQNLWIGTNAGISRFNGRSFTNYTIANGLSNNFVQCILQDKNGILWFGTFGGGISKYNPSDGKAGFTNYSTADGLINNLVISMIQDKNGNIWIGTIDGLSRFDGKSFKNYTIADGLPNNHIESLLEDKNGNLWVGTGWGLSRMDQNGSFGSYIATDELTKNSFLSIHEDKHGNLWFGTYQGVLRLKADGSIMKLNEARGLTNNQVNSILEDKAGNLWFGTENGISRFDQDGKYFVAYTTAQGLVNNAVMSFCEDDQGNLWFGTNGGGISKLDKTGKSFTNYYTSQGLPDVGVRSMAKDRRGNLWFGTDGGGVYRLDSARKVFTNFTVAQGLAGRSIRCIAEDKNGNMWFGSANNGVSMLDKEFKSFTTYTTNQGLSSNNVRDVTEDKNGNIWFNTLGGGVSRLDKERTSFTNYSTDQGLGNNYSWPMLIDKHGNLWIGTEVGLSRFDGKTFKNYSKTDGMADNEAGDVTMDKTGVIWLASNKGLTALKGFVKSDQINASSQAVSLTASNDLSNEVLSTGEYKPVFEIYGKKTGYPIKAIDNVGIAHDSSIWSGTGGFLGDKLIRFNFSKVSVNPRPPNVIIQNIKINNETISWYGLKTPIAQKTVDSITVAPYITEEGITMGEVMAEGRRNAMKKKFSAVKFDSIVPFYPLPVHLVLPYLHNNISFEFAAIEPARPYLVKYQYMLEGYDKEWNPVTEQTTASFGNIQEGSYTFKLKAQSPDRVWSEPLSYTFKVLPPWHRTWWAYTVYIFAFLVAIWSFIKWRERTLKKEKNILEEKVVERTHELQEEKEKVESTLSELKVTQAQLIQSEKMASMGELTAGIAHEIQNPLNFVNNFASINAELIDEMKVEMGKGNNDEVKALANDIFENEQKIMHHGKRAESIVKGMLQHSRTSTGTKEPTDINALADEYMRLSYHGLRAKDKSFNSVPIDIGISIDLDPTLPLINVIPQDIGRVLLNLFNNAFWACAERGRMEVPSNSGGKRNLPSSGLPFSPSVTLTTKYFGDSEAILAMGSSPPHHIEIRIHDNGTGIPSHIIDKIFQPFFTTKPTGQGTGLGLSLAYDIINAHRGELKFETTEGEGTTFIVQLPIV